MDHQDSNKSSGLPKLILGISLALILAGLILTINQRDGLPLFGRTDPVIGQNMRIVSNTQTYRFDATATPVSTVVIAQANAIQDVLVNIYKRVDPSVVNIDVISTVRGVESDSSGSGFVFDTNGYIITNAHVVQGARQIYVVFRDGYSAQAKVIGTDDYSDLAVIKVETDKSRLIPVTLGDSAKLEVGQSVIAIGNPFGLLSSMTTGIISATGRTLNSAQILQPRTGQPFQNPAIVQIDAVINPGNSGGPLLNLAGEVIGINTAIRSETGQFQGIGFAVPVNTVKRVIPQLIQKGYADYTWLGIYAISPQQTEVPGLTFSAIAENYKLPTSYGVLIESVVEGSPAAQAGLRGGTEAVTFRGVQLTLGGDIIVAVNKTPIRDFDDLTGYLVTSTEPGQKVTLTLYRGDQLVEVDVMLAVRPRN